MKNTVRNFLYVSLLMLLPLWTACDKDVHENESHGLAVGMEWLDGIEPTDITSPVNLWIYDADGHEVEAMKWKRTSFPLRKNWHPACSACRRATIRL